MMGKGRGRESLEEVRDFHTKVSSRSNIRDREQILPRRRDDSAGSIAARRWRREELLVLGPVDVGSID